MTKIYLFTFLLVFASGSSQIKEQKIHKFATAIVNDEKSSDIVSKYIVMNELFRGEAAKRIDWFKEKIGKNARFEIYTYNEARLKNLGYPMYEVEDAYTYFVVFNDEVYMPVLVNKEYEIISCLTLKKANKGGFIVDTKK